MSEIPGFLRVATARELAARERGPASPGYTYVVVDDLERSDSGWSLAPSGDGRLCRARVGDSYCRREAVVLLQRGTWPGPAARPNLWAYCQDREHLYGRRFVAGRLEEIIVVESHLVPSDS